MKGLGVHHWRGTTLTVFHDGCFGKSYTSFSGVCENVDGNSGLLILIPDNLNRSLTKIEINLHEKI